jgi:MerR family transcriptional regulator/heat shock protein HspR
MRIRVLTSSPKQGRTDVSRRHGVDTLETTPVFAISVVAQLTGMHPQTLRQYDRVGLVTPQRTAGGGRRYSARDVERLREIQQLSAEGIGLIGVKRILDLEQLNEQLEAHIEHLVAELEAARQVMGETSPPDLPAAQTSAIVLRDRSTVVVWRRPQSALD